MAIHHVCAFVELCACRVWVCDGVPIPFRLCIGARGVPSNAQTWDPGEGLLHFVGRGFCELVRRLPRVCTPNPIPRILACWYRNIHVDNGNHDCEWSACTDCRWVGRHPLEMLHVPLSDGQRCTEKYGRRINSGE